MLFGVGVVVWALNPYAALLVLPALHLWLLLVSPRAASAPAAAALALVALALVPLALLIAFYARELGRRPRRDRAGTAVLLLAGGHVGVAAAVLWSLAFGCVAAATLLALTPPAPRRRSRDRRRRAATIRGPLSYARSLGGTARRATLSPTSAP